MSMRSKRPVYDAEDKNDVAEYRHSTFPDFRIFRTRQGHSRDRCKSDEFLKGVGVGVGVYGAGVAELICRLVRYTINQVSS